MFSVFIHLSVLCIGLFTVGDDFSLKPEDVILLNESAFLPPQRKVLSALYSNLDEPAQTLQPILAKVVRVDGGQVLVEYEDITTSGPARFWVPFAAERGVIEELYHGSR